MKRELTCIICPRGCTLSVQLEGKKVVEIAGNSCRRGEEYAREECCSPKRTVTSTVRCVNGGRIAVKTDRPIPKEHVMDCMKKINAVVASLPVQVGDVLLEEVYGSRLVATENAWAAEE